MSSSVFERTRALHVDIEDMREHLLQRIQMPAASNKDRILLDHEVKKLQDDLRACEANLLGLYEDNDGVRAGELASMSGGEGMWTAFYDTLSAIRQYHAKFPNAGRLAAASKSDNNDKSTNAAAADSDAAPVGVDTNVTFSAEEAFGSRLDMHELFERYLNLPQFATPAPASNTTNTTNTTTPTPTTAPPKIDYLTFLQTFASSLTTLPREKKQKLRPEVYRKWLTDARDYLLDFHKRIRPLVDTNTILQIIRDDFQQRWNDKQVAGWFEDAKVEPAGAASTNGATNPAAAAATAAAPAADATSNTADPLYCKACAKLFAKQSVYDAHLPGKKHIKNMEILQALQAPAAPATNTSAASTGETESATTKRAEQLFSLALLEEEIIALSGLLSTELDNTIAHIQKKATRTYEEIQAEARALEEEIERAKRHAKEGGAGEDGEGEGEDEDPNAPIYNPLNLPLGFDGKPIPYWLYKLNGLNLKFDCEICGNYTYQGPRNFERHFTEWRHAYGMRALGIPNTKHFAHITKMADAVALFEKLKKSGTGAQWKADDEEEYEDSEGNVFNKRTYLELQKQGLV